MRDRSLTRRRLLGAALASIATSTLIPTSAIAADLPKLAESDPSAQALGYVENTAKIDPKKEPTFQKGRACAGCTLYQTAQASGGYAPCAAFPGKQVNANGWCRAFTPKPAG